jgi:hypothetical protein
LYEKMKGIFELLAWAFPLGVKGKTARLID